MQGYKLFVYDFLFKVQIGQQCTTVQVRVGYEHDFCVFLNCQFKEDPNGFVIHLIPKFPHSYIRMCGTKKMTIGFVYILGYIQYLHILWYLILKHFQQAENILFYTVNYQKQQSINLKKRLSCVQRFKLNKMICLIWKSIFNFYNYQDLPY